MKGRRRRSSIDFYSNYSWSAGTAKNSGPKNGVPLDWSGLIMLQNYCIKMSLMLHSECQNQHSTSWLTSSTWSWQSMKSKPFGHVLKTEVLLVVFCHQSWLLQCPSYGLQVDRRSQSIKKVYAGVSRLHFFYLRGKIMEADMACPVLEILRLPGTTTDIDALKLLAAQFEAKASRPVFRGCVVGALDGLTVFIKAPSAAETENVFLLAYYYSARPLQASKLVATEYSPPHRFHHRKCVHTAHLTSWASMSTS